MRCQWRPVPSGSGHAKHMPGDCRQCWKPCWNKVEDGSHCETCLGLLATHDNAAVRLALAEEDDLPRDVLELLATDMEVEVASTAMYALREQGFSPEEEAPSRADLWEW